IKEEQAATAQNRKLPVCYDDDDDEEESNSLKDNIISELPPYSAVTPSKPIDSLSMGDEHLDTILATKSDELIKSCVENLVPNPSESEVENSCDVSSCFTTFSNILFDAEYEFDSVDDQSLHNEDFSEKIFSNPLFEEEISSIKKNQHHFNAESDLVESMLNRDSSIISSSSKIDSLLDEFFEIDLTFTPDDPMPPSIEEDDDDSRDTLIRKEFFDNYSLSIPENESFHFDIPLSSRPPAKPPDGNTGILNIKMMGDVSDQKVPIPELTITLVSNQEKSPDLLSHRGFENFQIILPGRTKLPHQFLASLPGTELLHQFLAPLPGRWKRLIEFSFRDLKTVSLYSIFLFLI
nr:hypothetical protein [Tanacetum cinerariifolium]